MNKCICGRWTDSFLCTCCDMTGKAILDNRLPKKKKHGPVAQLVERLVEAQKTRDRSLAGPQ